MEPLTLTNSEWYVLDSLWERSPMTVMELVSALHLTVEQALALHPPQGGDGGAFGPAHFLVEGRTRHYTPAVERQSAARQETRSFLDRVYQGSVGLMVSSLVRDEALSREDLDQLYEILRQAEERIT